MNKKNFTYFFLDKSLVNSIRFVYKKDIVVITIYYAYRSIIFRPILEKFNYENALIFEWYEEHEKEFHKEDTPYDWHVHISVKKEDIELFLKEIFKVNKLPDKDLKNIITFLNHPEKQIKNIQYKGSENNQDLEDFKKKLKKERFQYNVFQKEIFEEHYMRLSFFLLRFKTIQFKLNDKLLDNLKSIGPLNHSKKSQDQIIEMFEKIKKTKLEFDIDINPDKKKKTLTKGKNIIIYGKEEWEKRLIQELIIACDLDYYSLEYKLKDMELNLNNAYVEFLALILLAYQRFYSYGYYKKMNLKNYLINRLELELSWSIFQSSKILREEGIKNYSDIMKQKLKHPLLLECHLMKAYFLYYARFQSCIKFESKVSKDCLLKVNLLDPGFKKAIDLAYEKIKLVYNELDKKTGLMSSHKLSLFI